MKWQCSVVILYSCFRVLQLMQWPRWACLTQALQGPIAGTTTVPRPPMSVVSEAMLMQVSMAGDMATWLVAHSQMHPNFSELPVMYDMTMGGFEDPTTRNTAGRFEEHILHLQVCSNTSSVRKPQATPSQAEIGC